MWASSIGADVSLATTLTVNRCSGGRTVVRLKFADVPSCGSSSSAAAKRTNQVDRPSSVGARSSTTAQYRPVVPGHGVSRSLASASVAPFWSQTSIARPDNSQSPDDFAPTLISNGVPITAGDAMSQTARLVPCGLIATRIGSGSPVCTTPAISSGASAMVRDARPPGTAP